ARLRPALDEARARVADAHAAGQSGDDTARAWSKAVDEVVIELFRATLAAAPRGAGTPPVALIAVGGYGRSELCPGSDLDLWFITDKPNHPELHRIANDVLYPLWDLRLEVGHGVRSAGDCFDL